MNDTGLPDIVLILLYTFFVTPIFFIHHVARLHLEICAMYYILQYNAVFPLIYIYINYNNEQLFPIQ